MHVIGGHYMWWKNMEIAKSASAPIFIGRQLHINHFQNVFRTIFPLSSWFSSDSAPHVCFVIGPKLSGKSTLVSQMLEKRGSWNKFFKSPTLTIRLSPPLDEGNDLTNLIYDACKHPNIGALKSYEKERNAYELELENLQ